MGRWSLNSATLLFLCLVALSGNLKAFTLRELDKDSNTSTADLYKETNSSTTRQPNSSSNQSSIEANTEVIFSKFTTLAQRDGSTEIRINYSEIEDDLSTKELDGKLAAAWKSDSGTPKYTETIKQPNTHAATASYNEALKTSDREPGRTIQESSFFVVPTVQVRLSTAINYDQTSTIDNELAITSDEIRDTFQSTRSTEKTHVNVKEELQVDTIDQNIFTTAPPTREVGTFSSTKKASLVLESPGNLNPKSSAAQSMHSFSDKDKYLGYGSDGILADNNHEKGGDADNVFSRRENFTDVDEGLLNEDNNYTDYDAYNYDIYQNYETEENPEHDERGPAMFAIRPTGNLSSRINPISRVTNQSEPITGFVNLTVATESETTTEFETTTDSPIKIKQPEDVNTQKLDALKSLETLYALSKPPILFSTDVEDQEEELENYADDELGKMRRRFSDSKISPFKLEEQHK